jgi:hypothetical protein
MQEILQPTSMKIRTEKIVTVTRFITTDIFIQAVADTNCMTKIYGTLPAQKRITTTEI